MLTTLRNFFPQSSRVPPANDNLRLSFVSFINMISVHSFFINFIAILLFSFLLRRLRSSRPRRILVHLCIALLCLYCTFLFGIDLAVNSKWACPMVGALIHYFLLSTILWMGVEALNIYLMLVRVFNMNIRHFVLKSALIAWGRLSSMILSYWKKKNSPVVEMSDTLRVNLSFCQSRSYSMI